MNSVLILFHFHGRREFDSRRGYIFSSPLRLPDQVCTLGTGVKRFGREVHCNAVPKLRMWGAIPPFPVHLVVGIRI